MKYHITFVLPLSLAAVFLTSKNSLAQKKTPDDHYREVVHAIDSFDRLGKWASIVDAYSSLSKEYFIDDPTAYFYYSVKAENRDGILTSAKLIMEESGDSINSVIEKYANLYGDIDSNTIRNAFSKGVYNSLRSIEASTLANAKNRLDWEWIIYLSAMNQSNIDFRTIPVSAFRDNDTRLEAMYTMDSALFVGFCEQVGLRGFPTRKRTGLYSGKMMVPLIHFTALIDFKKHKSSSGFFIGQWRILLPQIYMEVKAGSMNAGFYGALYRELKQNISEGEGTSTDFLEKYKPL